MVELTGMVDRVIIATHVVTARGAGTRPWDAVGLMPARVQQRGAAGGDGSPPPAVATENRARGSHRGVRRRPGSCALDECARGIRRSFASTKISRQMPDAQITSLR